MGSRAKCYSAGWRESCLLLFGVALLSKKGEFVSGLYLSKIAVLGKVTTTGEEMDRVSWSGLSGAPPKTGPGFLQSFSGTPP